MTYYLIRKATLTAIADAVRSVKGITGKIPVTELDNVLSGSTTSTTGSEAIDDLYLINRQTLVNIAAIVRAKEGTTQEIPVTELAARILALKTDTLTPAILGRAVLGRTILGKVNVGKGKLDTPVIRLVDTAITKLDTPVIRLVDTAITKLDTPVITLETSMGMHSITTNFTNCDWDYEGGYTIAHGEPFYTMFYVHVGYYDPVVTVTMGGVDITADVLVDNEIDIPSVTGDIVITATASKVWEEKLDTPEITLEVEQEEPDEPSIKKLDAPVIALEAIEDEEPDVPVYSIDWTPDGDVYIEKYDTTAIKHGSSFVCNVGANEGWVLDSVEVLMGGYPITQEVVAAPDYNVINIPSVTGNLEITVCAVPVQLEKLDAPAIRLEAEVEISKLDTPSIELTFNAPTPYVDGELLKWNSVDGANGYDIDTDSFGLQGYNLIRDGSTECNLQETVNEGIEYTGKSYPASGYYPVKVRAIKYTKPNSYTYRTVIYGEWSEPIQFYYTNKEDA